MNIAELINNTLKEAQELMTSKTVVGEPIRTDTHTVIPVSKVMFGFGGGGGEGVEIRGFGSFYKRHRKGRIGINPKTGEKTEITEKFVSFYKPGKFLKEAINKG